MLKNPIINGERNNKINIWGETFNIKSNKEGFDDRYSLSNQNGEVFEIFKLNDNHKLNELELKVFFNENGFQTLDTNDTSAYEQLQDLIILYGEGTGTYFTAQEINDLHNFKFNELTEKVVSDIEYILNEVNYIRVDYDDTDEPSLIKDLILTHSKEIEDKYNFNFTPQDLDEVTEIIKKETKEIFNYVYNDTERDYKGYYSLEKFNSVDELEKHFKIGEYKLTNQVNDYLKENVIEQENQITGIETTVRGFKDNIKVEGHIGTWYVIDEKIIDGQKLYLLEHETYGDETANLIVDENYKLKLQDVYNGFKDYDDVLEDLKVDNQKYQEAYGIMTELANTNHEAYIKSIISIETGITNIESLNKIYEEYRNNDSINLLNEGITDFINENELDYFQEETSKDYADKALNYVGNLTEDVKPFSLKISEDKSIEVANFTLVMKDENNKKIYKHFSAYDDKVAQVENFKKGDFVKIFGKENTQTKNDKEFTKVNVLKADMLKENEKNKTENEAPAEKQEQKKSKNKDMER